MLGEKKSVGEKNFLKLKKSDSFLFGSLEHLRGKVTVVDVVEAVVVGLGGSKVTFVKLRSNFSMKLTDSECES